MKKFLLILMILIPAVVCSQNINFEAKSDGTFKSAEDDNTFIVVDYAGSTKEELYANVLTAVAKNYNSPNNVITKLDNKMISVNANSGDNKVWIQTPGIKLFFIVKYVLQFEFKDEKIKVNAPEINHMYCTYESKYNSTYDKWLDRWEVFVDGKPNPNPKKKREATINDINKLINTTVNNLLPNMEDTNNDW